MTSKLGALALTLTVAAVTLSLQAQAFANGGGTGQDLGHGPGHALETTKDRSPQRGSNAMNTTMTQSQTQAHNSSLSRIVMTFERKRLLAEIVVISREVDRALAAKNQQLAGTLFLKDTAAAQRFGQAGGTNQEILTALQRAGVPIPQLPSSIPTAP